MLYYRLYFTGSDGKFSRFEEFEGNSDEEALANARSMKHSRDIEVWQQRRKVGVVHAAALENLAG